MKAFPNSVWEREMSGNGRCNQLAWAFSFSRQRSRNGNGRTAIIDHTYHFFPYHFLPIFFRFDAKQMGNRYELVEGLTLSKEPENTVFYGSMNTELWIYDMEAGTLKVACTNLLGETEALEITPEGLLLIGTHNVNAIKLSLGEHIGSPLQPQLRVTHNVPFGLHAFDAQTCQVIEADELSNQFNDVEGIAMPVAACQP